MRPRLSSILAALFLALSCISQIAHADALDDALASQCPVDARLANTASRLLREHAPIDRAALRDDAEAHGVPAPSVRAWVGRGSPAALLDGAVAFVTAQHAPPSWARCALARGTDTVALVMVPRLASLTGSLAPAAVDEHRRFDVTLPPGARAPVCMRQAPDGAVDRCDTSDLHFGARGEYAFQILAETAQGPLPFATWHVRAGPPGADGSVVPDAQPTNALQLLGAINRVRARVGCDALRPDPMLAEVARQRAVTLAARGAVAHALVRDDSPVTRLRAAGISVDRVAENVARAHSIGEASSRLDASPSHRANRVDPAIDTVGIGVATEGDDVYVVELYAARPRIGAAGSGRAPIGDER